MKKFLLSFLMLTLVFFAAACGEDETTTPEKTTTPDATTPEDDPLDQELAGAFEDLAVGKEAYITTIGQGEELDIIWAVMESVFDDAEERNNTIVNDDLLEPATVEEGAIVFLVVGASSKGMGDAGVDQSAEIARANAFSARAEAGEITLVLIHSGGMTRRGTLSDPMIEAAASDAALMLVLISGNEDAFFNDLSDTTDVPLYLYTNNPALIPPLKQLFGK